MRISQSKQLNTFEAYGRDRGPLVWMREKVWGQTYGDYQIEQRGSWLETMGPTFNEAVSFLNLASRQLNAAYLMCQTTSERLPIEGRAARDGWNITGWIREQAKELVVGIDDLEAQPKAFKLEQRRFHD